MIKANSTSYNPGTVFGTEALLPYVNCYIMLSKAINKEGNHMYGKRISENYQT